MAISFNKQRGAATRNVYEMKTGENVVRFVGPILARYVYWVRAGGRSVPMECLEFNRDTETFDKRERDYVREFFPDVSNPSWGYIATVIDPDDGKVKPFYLKRKLWDQICLAAEDLGDPTDPDTGWDCVFNKVKTGPNPMNVEYQLRVLKCKSRSLTEAEQAEVSDLPDLDKLFPRPTPEEQKAAIEKLLGQSGSPTMDASVSSELEDLS